MSKAIKVEEDVYNQLDDIRGKGETFSMVIAQLLEARVQIFQFLNVLEGAIKYHEWKAKRLEDLEEAQSRRDRSSVH